VQGERSGIIGGGGVEGELVARRGRTEAAETVSAVEIVERIEQKVLINLGFQQAQLGFQLQGVQLLHLGLPHNAAAHIARITSASFLHEQAKQADNQ
jgi:hypothetical protein